MSKTDLVASPFGSSAVAETSGSRMTQSREVAEVQTKFLMAERFPRDERKSMDGIINAFSRRGLAERSQYQYAKGGTEITGPSIHSAQAIAQQWGNIEFGWREMSRGIGHDGVPFSEVEAYALDLQSRVPSRITFIVPHWRDTRQGGYKLRDERDIYELCSNQAQRRKRACILSVLPQDVVDTAMEQASLTLKANADVTPEGIKKLLDAFAPLGVTKEMIEKRIQRRIESIAAGQVVNLKRIYASLRDGMSDVSEWFEAPDTAGDGATGPAAAPATVTGAAGLKGRLKDRAKTKGAEGAAAAATAAPAAAPAPAAEAAPKPDANSFIARLDDADSVPAADAVLADAKKAGLTPDQLQLVVDAHRLATAAGD